MNVYGYDFTPYAEKGFLFTPEGYSGRYQSVGYLRVVIWPEMTRTAVSEQKPGDREFGDWRSEEINYQVAIDSLYVLADSMGADAVIRFETNTVTESIQDGQRTGVEARGFAIDREEQ